MARKKKEVKPVQFTGCKDLPDMPVSQGSMEVNKTASWRSIRPVIIDDKCRRCMICWKVCPEPAISPTDPPVIDYDFCKGCGICIEECPFDAIDTEPEGK
ncbi:MAG TPA: 4Fe-4S dicluster domain-containing protein [bacterium]|nr:4Fe-4S dicluster domain-containing protein [bacterium]